MSAPAARGHSAPLTAIRRHWDIGVGLAAGIACFFLLPLAEPLPDWLMGPLPRALLSAFAALLGYRLARFLKILLRLLLWLVDDTFLRPCAWTIVGGLVGAAWCTDLALRHLGEHRLAIASAALLGYPLGALVSLLPRGALVGFRTLREKLAEHDDAGKR